MWGRVAAIHRAEILPSMPFQPTLLRQRIIAHWPSLIVHSLLLPFAIPIEPRLLRLSHARCGGTRAADSRFFVSGILLVLAASDVATPIRCMDTRRSLSRTRPHALVSLLSAADAHCLGSIDRNFFQTRPDFEVRDFARCDCSHAFACGWRSIVFSRLRNDAGKRLGAIPGLV
jgi:hypothetical protein